VPIKYRRLPDEKLQKKAVFPLYFSKKQNYSLPPTILKKSTQSDITNDFYIF